MSVLLRAAGLAGAFMYCLVAGAGAGADDDTDAGSTGDGFWISTVEQTPDIATTANSSPAGDYHEEPACDGICTGQYTCPDGSFETHGWFQGPGAEILWEGYWCPSTTTPPTVTNDLVATAFRRIPLPPTTLSIQPPGGKTLVNFETNFFTDHDRTLARTVRLLGQRVDLRIQAHSYTWHFDDGGSITTREPGAPYPSLEVTHNYLRTGDYRPRLTITWRADYRVAGGAWQPVPGNVSIEGAPADLKAIEAQPTLVGYGG